MFRFYQRAALLALGLLLLSLISGYACYRATFIESKLFPSADSPISWRAKSDTDERMGGSSSMNLDDQSYALEYDYTLIVDYDYPFASLLVEFVDQEGKAQLVDLSAYKQLSFNIRCQPENVLAFELITVDEQVTVEDKPATYRRSGRHISCSEQWQRVELELDNLITPEWWLEAYELPFSKQEYGLNHVAQLTLSASKQSPKNTLSRVQLNELTFNGEQQSYLIGYLVALLASWIVFLVGVMRYYTKALVSELKHKLENDRPLVAYQQLSIEPQRDKEKEAVLRFMATEYCNPELNAELAVSQLGLSRAKINDVLKQEMGCTFSTYLNKLRLTEAARLLSEKAEASVAEIAYSVGYNNVSYFNKLFKGSYNCTPKTFQSVCQKGQA